MDTQQTHRKCTNSNEVISLWNQYIEYLCFKMFTWHSVRCRWDQNQIWHVYLSKCGGLLGLWSIKGVFSLGHYSQRSLTSPETHVMRALNSPNFLELFCIDIPDIADFLYLDTSHLQNKTGMTKYATQQTKILPGLLTDLS